MEEDTQVVLKVISTFPGPFLTVQLPLVIVACFILVPCQWFLPFDVCALRSKANSSAHIVIHGTSVTPVLT